MVLWKCDPVEKRKRVSLIKNHKTFLIGIKKVEKIPMCVCQFSWVFYHIQAKK